MDTFNLIGVGVVVLASTLLFLSLMGLLTVVLFWKTRKIVVPKITLLLVTGLEVPIKKLGRVFKIDDASIDHTVANMRNLLNKKAYSKVPYSMRAVFMPQCLRHPDCPARTNEEGILCVNCGRCGLGELKYEAESRGMRFFIAPGSSLIKRMILKYKPEAVFGVGCPMEIKEGGAAMSALRMPSQVVILLRDGCVNTRVDVEKMFETMFLTDDLRMPHTLDQSRLDYIKSLWACEKKVIDLRKI